MIKRIFLLASLAIFAWNVQAQFVFDEGDIAVNAGVGFISSDGLIPSLNLSAELGLFPTADVGLVSIGGDFEYKYSRLMGLNYSQITIGPRAAWHMQMDFIENTNFDLYAGLGAGLRVYSVYNWTTNSLDPKLGPYMEAFIGGRMMLNDDFGLFAELGGGAIAVTKAGVIFRF